jgi:hypothetical protein
MRVLEVFPHSAGHNEVDTGVEKGKSVRVGEGVRRAARNVKPERSISQGDQAVSKPLAVFSAPNVER